MTLSGTRLHRASQAKLCGDCDRRGGRAGDPFSLRQIRRHRQVRRREDFLSRQRQSIRKQPRSFERHGGIGNRDCGNIGVDGFKSRRSGRLFRYRIYVRWQFASEANNGFASFCFPIAATKARRGHEIPLKCFCGIFCDFKMAAEFERNHCIIGLLIEQRQLPAGISAAASATNARRNLFPIRHFLEAL